MKVTMLRIGLVLSAGALPAQDPTAPTSGAKAQLEVLQQEERAVMKAWQTEREKQAEEAARAQAEGQPVKPKRMSPDLSPLVAKYEAAAKEFARTDAAVPFLLWLLQGRAGNAQASKAAAATLAAEHADSDELASFGPMLQYLPGIVDADAAAKLIDAIEAKNTNPEVLAWSALAKHGKTIDTAARDSEEYAAAREALLARAAKAEEPVKGELLGRIEVREKFGVGCTAPDITGVDLDGVEFRLSDYKGKVVFLDFWGDW